MSTKSQQERGKQKAKTITKSLDNSSSDSLLGQPLNHAMLGSKIDTDDAYPTVEEWLGMPDNEKINVLHDSLLELYLNVKIRNFGNTIDSEKVDEELDKLK